MGKRNAVVLGIGAIAIGALVVGSIGASGSGQSQTVLTQIAGTDPRHKPRQEMPIFRFQADHVCVRVRDLRWWKGRFSWRNCWRPMT